jgi:hypothetical protein
MSNEYENQLARERQEKRDHQRKLEQAAQRAAQSAELARLEQNASLRKQEEIAETNNFRTTVLGAIQLLDGKQKSDFIIQQISSRVNDLKQKTLEISSTNLLIALDINKLISNLNHNITKTDSFQTLIQDAKKFEINNINKITINSNLATILCLQKDKMAAAIEGDIDKAKSKLKFAFVVFIVAAIAGFVLGFLADHPKIETNLMGIVAIGGYPFLWMILFRLPNVWHTQKLKQDLLPILDKRDLFLIEFKRILLATNEIKALPLTDTIEISNLYFKKMVYPKILDEQSFIPSVLHPQEIEWINAVISEKTSFNVKKVISEFISNPFESLEITETGIQIKN